jgi:hypothetical protein
LRTWSTLLLVSSTEEEVRQLIDRFQVLALRRRMKAKALITMVKWFLKSNGV